MRKPNIRSAAADLAFAAVAFVLGVMGYPLAYAVFAFLGAVAVWLWTRRRALGQMNWRMRAANVALALGMLAIVLGVLYGIGLAVGGHT